MKEQERSCNKRRKTNLQQVLEKFMMTDSKVMIILNMKAGLSFT